VLTRPKSGRAAQFNVSAIKVAMKKSIILCTILMTFYANLFLIKSMVLNFVISLSFIASPVLAVPVLIKSRNKRDKKDEIFALVLWGLALIPTGMMITMTIIFGMPPEGYGLMDMFR
jgi:uncharacterized membrane protein